MIAYHKTALDNLVIKQQVMEAGAHLLFSSTKEKELMQAYPINLYTPNLFVKIGLGVLTLLIVLAFLGLAALITNVSNPGALLLFCCGCTYAGLEVMVKNRHYNSGVDNMLMWSVLMLFCSSAMMIFSINQHPEVFGSLFIFIPALFITLRFTDSIAGVISVLSFLGCLFYGLFQVSVFQVNYIFIACIVASVFLYWLLVKLMNTQNSGYYKKVLYIAMITTLFTAYFFGNFYVVSSFYGANPAVVSRVATAGGMGSFYWVLTMLLPLLYLITGIQKKDIVFIRTGMILLIASALTFRYFFDIISVEIALLLGGLLLVTAVYLIVKYLKQNRYGFTFKEVTTPTIDVPNLEGIAVGEVFGKSSQPQQGTLFGGGSFGGAGAGSDY